MKSVFIVFFISSFFISCGKLTPREKMSKNSTPIKVSRYHLDGEGSLFSNVKWYYYDFMRHLVWPYYDVYALKSKGKFYKIQIVSYYNPKDPADDGYYTIRLVKDNKTTTLSVNAIACGNPNNPKYAKQYDDCIKNPLNRRFTYVNFLTSPVKITKMFSERAKKSRDWQIAFRRNKIRLNSGVHGPLDVVGALAYRHKPLFDTTGEPLIEQIEKITTEKSFNHFLTHKIDLRRLSFYPPEGPERVIQESYWYKFFSKEKGKMKANPKNWWIVRCADGKSYFKFSVSKIDDKFISGLRKIAFTFKYSLQKDGDPEFPLEFRTWKIGILDESKLKSPLCLDFNTKKQVDCKKDSSWDLKLSLKTDRKAKSKFWILNTKNGAAGPWNDIYIDKIKSGSE